MPHVEAVKFTMSNVKGYGSLTEITDRAATDTVHNATPKLETKANLENSSPTTLMDSVYGTPFFIEDVLVTLLCQALSGTCSQPHTMLKDLFKKLGNKSVKNR